MVKSKLRYMISLVILVLILGACGEKSDKSKDDNVITIGTHPVGIAYHSAGSGIAKVVSEHSNLKMIVSPFSGGTAWTPLLDKGDIEVGISAKPSSYWGFHGEYDFQSPNKNTRLLVKGNDIVVSGLTVREDSGIESLADLKGKTIASGYSGDAIIDLIYEVQLNSVGLTFDDVKLTPVTDVGQGLDALREGRVDAAFTGTPTVASFLEADNAVGLKTLNYGDLLPEDIDSITEEEKEQMQKLVPGIELVKYKGGFVEEDMIALKYPIVLVSSTHLSNEKVYELTKTLWENYEELHPIFNWLEEWDHESMLDEDPVIPYHEGTVEFFKDEGIWTDDLEKIQSNLLKDTE